ncbi:hypothetical protein BKA82DRAFT_4015237 [Pisolithus tinctorius]|nr:hypothetical protein BKA82DRAFT_4015237 [Pisolithus tinctorius]
MTTVHTETRIFSKLENKVKPYSSVDMDQYASYPPKVWFGASSNSVSTAAQDLQDSIAVVGLFALGTRDNAGILKDLNIRSVLTMRYPTNPVNHASALRIALSYFLNIAILLIWLSDRSSMVKVNGRNGLES